MQVLLINPNTSVEITDLVLRAANAVRRPTTTLRAVTGRFGGRYIATRATYAIAGHAALDAWAEHRAGVDGVVLACFGDPGLAALKELSPVPVIGMVEATLAAAGTGRFGIVTGGRLWEPMLREMVVLSGKADQLAGIRTVAPSGADIARDPDGALALLAAACTEAARVDHAECVILGGAGLAGLTHRLQPLVPVPLIDGVAAVIAATEQAVDHARTRTPANTIGHDAALLPKIACHGVSAALAAAVEHG